MPKPALDYVFKLTCVIIAKIHRPKKDSFLVGQIPTTFNTVSCTRKFRTYSSIATFSRIFWKQTLPWGMPLNDTPLYYFRLFRFDVWFIVARTRRQSRPLTCIRSLLWSIIHAYSTQQSLNKPIFSYNKQCRETNRNKMVEQMVEDCGCNCFRKLYGFLKHEYY